MTRKIEIAVLFGLALAWLPSMKAQSKSSRNSDSNIETYTDLLRTNVRDNKVQLLAVLMQFTPDEAAVFWPIYQRYNAQLTDLENKESSLVKEYAENSESMTDPKVDELAETLITLVRKRNDLLKDVYEHVKAKLGAKTAARFMQVEQQLLLITSLKLASELPAGN
jgi:hypothetical protein